MTFGNISVDRAVAKNQENIPELMRWSARLEHLCSISEDSFCEIFQQIYINFNRVVELNGNSSVFPSDVYIPYQIRENLKEIILLEDKIINHWQEANDAIKSYRSFDYEIERLHDNGMKCLAYTYYKRGQHKMLSNGKGGDDVLKDIFKALELDGQRLVRNEEHEGFLRFLFDHAVTCYIMGYNGRNKAMLVLEYFERFVDPSAAKDLRYKKGKKYMGESEWAFFKRGYDIANNIQTMIGYINTIFSKI